MSDKVLNNQDEELDASVLYKEVFIRRQPDDWNEITLNTGGVSSTLQDIKPQQRSGAFVYKDIPNRFLTWRSEGNVLEIVEHSLDTNLQGNQVRYKFTDSQILDGTSINETSDYIILLIPTASSVHRLRYPHPKKYSVVGESYAHSILHGVNENDASDPRNFYVINTPPCAVVCAASCIMNANVAVFALSLANSSIFLIQMNCQTGKTDIMTFSEESLMPKFFTGITDALLKKDTVENVAISLLFHQINKELYLFSLDKLGCLKAWSCHRGTAVSSLYLLEKDELSIIKNQKYRIFPGVYNNEFVIHCCMQGFFISSVVPSMDGNSFKLFETCKTSMPKNYELMSICSTKSNEIWCNWLSDVEAPHVSSITLGKDFWYKVKHSRPQNKITFNQVYVKDLATLYIDEIFSSGFFTANDVMKALSIYKPTAVLKPNINIRDQICAVVEAEIYSEVGEQDMYEDEFNELSSRCWSRLFSCCIQYIHTSLIPLHLIRLGNMTIIINKVGFSLIKPIEQLELAWKSGDYDLVQVEYMPLLALIKKLNIGECLEWVDIKHLTGESIPQQSIPLHHDLVKLREDLANVLLIFSDEFVENFFTELIKELELPSLSSKRDNTRSFCSNSGISAIISGVRDFCTIRLEIIRKFLLMFELLEYVSEVQLTRTMLDCKDIIINFYKMYYALFWTTANNINIDTPVIFSYASSNCTDIMLPDFENSVISLLNILWPYPGNSVLAQHLLSTKQFFLLECYSRIVDHQQWKTLVAEALIGMGEFTKAYDKCMQGHTQKDLQYYINCIHMFENNQRSDLATEMAKEALHLCSHTMSKEDHETLQSILFLQELNLNHFNAAFSWMDSCQDLSRQSAFLQRLVSTMINAGRVNELIDFNLTSVAKDLDLLLSKRALRSPFHQAEMYYNLLYAIHIKNCNYKSAASVMFEKGMRSETNEMKWRCFGACLNSMLLLPQDEAWILKPNLSGLFDESAVCILSADDVRKEYELAGAKYNLGNENQDASEDEVISLCTFAREYRIGMRICKVCKRSFVPVISAFTAECINLNDSDDWFWLKQNEIDDIIVDEKNYGESCWKILREFLNCYEKPNESELHKAVLGQILQSGMFVPTWLATSYSKKNTSEYLKMLYKYGRLDEAAKLARDYIRAAQGIGWELFSISAPILPQNPAVYLPIHTIDLIINELKFHKIKNDLEPVFEKYLELVTRISEDKQHFL